MARIWGIDVGTTSIGWAVVDHDDAGSGHILGMGCRIFPEARDPDGTPYNQNRRQKRLVRRQLRRRRRRRRLLNEELGRLGLLPPFCARPARPGAAEDDPWHLLMRGEEDPVALRARGLAERLGPHELGRALYHLAQRRHFKGRDLEDEDSDGSETPPAAGKKKKKSASADDGALSADEQAAKASRDVTVAALKASNRTLGQFLAALPEGQRRRGEHHADRGAIEKEFDQLWAAQAEHHAVLRDPDVRAKVQDTIFAQRPVFWRKSTLGQCRFMPGEDLCPKGSWLSQQRRMLEKVNNLELAGGNRRRLDDDERATILARLQSQASMTWSAVRKALAPLYKASGKAGEERGITFNLELDGGSTLLGNPLEAKLAGIFGEGWVDHPLRDAIRAATHERLWAADYGEVGTQRVTILSADARKKARAEAAQGFIADFGITGEQAAKLTALKLPTGWEPFSTAALEAFLPELEAGVRLGDLLASPNRHAWREHTFPSRAQPTGEFVDRLPTPTQRHPEEMQRIAALRNPTVVRVLNELRKVVNNLLALHGKPDKIRVELARDIGKSKREREDTQRGQRRRESRRNAAAKDLRENGIAQPSRDTIEKYLLWEECARFDPYSGEPISFADLFGNLPLFDVEHIWPRSRCFDDGHANKTLCKKTLNALKTNRTPFEAFSHTPQWPEIKDRLFKHVQAGRMAPGKFKRFCREEFKDDFAARQLVDTGFAARQTVALLNRLWPDVGPQGKVHVEVVTGRVTAHLRRLWGLNHVLADDGEKTRADHRHHALDALVVACTHPGMTQRLSRYFQAKDDATAQQPRLDPPWPTIRADATRQKDQIVVSHRVRKKVSGPLHGEMPWGYTGRDVVKDGKTFGIYVKRMPVEKLGLETLKIDDVSDLSRNARFVVCDEACRAALLRHLEAARVPAAKAYPPYPRLGADGPEIRKVRVHTIQQKDLMAPVSKVGERNAGADRTPLGYADPANNHHIAIFRRTDGKAEFEVVSLFEAMRRLGRREPAIRREMGDGATFVMSLAPGDAVEIPSGKTKGRWIVQGAWANGQVVLESDSDAAHATTTRPSPGALLKSNARKISVDPIGRIRPAND